MSKKPQQTNKGDAARIFSKMNCREILLLALKYAQCGQARIAFSFFDENLLSTERCAVKNTKKLFIYRLFRSKIKW